MLNDISNFGWEIPHISYGRKAAAAAPHQFSSVMNITILGTLARYYREQIAYITVYIIPKSHPWIWGQ